MLCHVGANSCFFHNSAQPRQDLNTTLMPPTVLRRYLYSNGGHWLVFKPQTPGVHKVEAKTAGLHTILPQVWPTCNNCVQQTQTLSDTLGVQTVGLLSIVPSDPHSSTSPLPHACVVRLRLALVHIFMCTMDRKRSELELCMTLARSSRV